MVVAQDYCPAYSYWPPYTASDPWQNVRHWASRYQFQAHPAFWRVAALIILTLLWPVRVLCRIGRHAYSFAPRIARRSGIPAWKQCLDQLWLAFRHGLPPAAYYHYALYDPARRVLATYYLHQYQAQSLYTSLNRDHCHPAIEDKSQFANWCARYNVPTAPLFGVCAQGTLHWQSGTSSIMVQAAGDLFVKPAVGRRGEGAMLWRKLPEGTYQDQHGTTLRWEELLAYLIQIGRHKAYVLQPRLRNHSAIASLSDGALCTARIVTGRTPLGDIAVVVATFKMPWRRAITNTHGMNSPIDLVTGRLGPAYTYSPICPGYDTYPGTGVRISGQRLPDWPEAVALVKRVHMLFDGYVFLGWDVALTTTGHLLLEGNAGWDVLTVQKPQRTPLSQTSFAAICTSWMQARANTPRVS